MEIRSTNADDHNASGLRIDITRKNRESIESRQPLTPKAADATRPDDPLSLAQKIKEARDEYREQRAERIANARLDYTERRNESITAARDVYEARMEKVFERRMENNGSGAPADSSDSVDLSNASRSLASLDAPANDEARAARVAELKALYSRGELPSDDLIARAAYRLLGGE